MSFTIAPVYPIGEARAAGSALSRECAPRASLDVFPRRVLDEALFIDLAVRERLRSDRSGDSFLLLLVAVDGEHSRPGQTPVWEAVAEALAETTCDSDVIGWFEQTTVMSAIVPAATTTNSRFVTIEKRVREELASRLDAYQLEAVSISAYVYSGESGATGDDGSSVDALLRKHRFWQQTRAASVAKRGLDVLGSLTLMALFSPLFLVAAALVKLTSPGPVLFRQTRIGHEGRRFPMLKLRTMSTNADAAPHREFVTEFIASSDSLCQSGDMDFKLKNDSRITSVGRVLRKTSLDELPQFWNVLRGNMSLVGPRPPIPYEVETYQPWHRRRVLDAKPGITGLWQVSGRSRMTFDEMVRLDVRYIKTRSLWTDIKILLATPAAVLGGKGAR